MAERRDEDRAEVQAAEERQTLREDRVREQDVDEWGVVVDNQADAKREGYIGRAAEDEGHLPQEEPEAHG